MSFGFSISDFIAVPQFAWQVYNALKDAPGDHQALSDEVLSLHKIVTKVEEGIAKQSNRLAEDEQQLLQDIATQCIDVLKDVQRILDKYKKHGRARVWNRVVFATKDLAPIRARIAAQNDRLNTFNGLLIQSSQARLEYKFDKIVANLKRKHGSVISVTSVQNLESSSDTWNALGRALEEQGITLDVVRSNHDNVVKLLSDAVIRGDVVHEMVANSDSTKKEIGYIEYQAQEEAQVKKNRTSSMMQSASTWTYTRFWGNLVGQLVTPRESLSVPNTTKDLTEIQDVFIRYPSYVQGELADILETVQTLSLVAEYSLSHDQEQALMKALADVTKLVGTSNRSPQSRISSFLKSRIIDPTFTYGSTILHVIARTDTRLLDDFLTWALTLDARLNVQDFDGQTPLVVAIRNSNCIVAKELIRNGADYTVRDRYGWLPLHYAVTRDVVDVVQVLCTSHTRDNPQIHISSLLTADEALSNPLYLAATVGHVATIKTLLTPEISWPSDWLLTDSEGKTPLHVLVRIDPMPWSDKYSSSTAAVLSANRIVSYLSTHHFAIVGGLLCQDRDKRNPFHCAILRGHVAMVEMLLDTCYRLGFCLVSEPTGDGASPYSLTYEVDLNRARIQSLLRKYSNSKSWE